MTIREEAHASGTDHAELSGHHCITHTRSGDGGQSGIHCTVDILVVGYGPAGRSGWSVYAPVEAGTV